MKKFITSVVALILMSQISFAQKAVLKVKVLDQEAIPGVITTDLEESYGDVFIDEISEIPYTLVQGDYEVVYKNRPVSGVFSKLYEVKLQTKDGVEKFYYDEDGNIVMTKIRLNNAQLPKDVLKELDKTYSDWTVLATTERLVSSEKKGSEVYKVLIQKGKKKDIVYFTGKGDYID